MRIHHTIRLTRLHIATGLLLGGFCLCPASGQASFQGLGTLPDSIISSRAFGVSADGSVVVGRSISSFGKVAFRWTSQVGLVGLGDFAGGVLNSFAVRMSADGSMVIGFGTSATAFEAFRWTSGEGMVSLGGLGNPTGGSFSFLSVANGVSADGSVVVGR
ncbi:MAG: PEP-CTERM sorting domain-containing protein, partial [Planctomycetes bacterium]|nr:PEP-CTERM sorting domain-containing protein [Planctomycetota bacterium]